MFFQNNHPTLNGQLPPNMKPGMGYDANMTNEFSALNLSVPANKVCMRYLNEKQNLKRRK